ncbi:MAG: hypothetical protein WD894_25965 [Pirellulales bacterium]
MTTAHGQSAFQVGDRVSVLMGPKKLWGVVVEDRGPLGVNGRRVFRVEIPIDPFEPMTMELPEDEMEAIAPDAEMAAPIESDEITDYLTNGGLISILRSNLSGGKYQPRAWLCRDQLGNITHTFVPERGMVGGQLVPSLAMRDRKILRPKREAVLSFVESFGLNSKEAERVVSEVGTTP